MWTEFLIIFAINGVKAVFGDDGLACVQKVKGCYHDTYPEAEMKIAGGYPNEEELEKVCPGLVKMADCFEEIKEECKLQIGTPVYDRDARFYKEICSKNSLLRSDYLTHVDCYKQIENASVYSTCYDEAIDVYNQYIQSKRLSIMEVQNRGNMHHTCFRMPYAHGCTAAEVQRSCGDDASETFIEVEKLKDSTSWFKHCLQVLGHKNEMYNDYLPSINVPEMIRKQIEKYLHTLGENAEQRSIHLF